MPLDRPNASQLLGDAVKSSESDETTLEQPAEQRVEPTGDETPDVDVEGDETTTETEQAETPETSPLVEVLAKYGIKADPATAEDQFQNLLQQAGRASQLEKYIRDSQASQQQNQQTPEPSPQKQGLPVFQDEWRDWVDEKGVPRSDAPAEVRQGWQSWAEFERKRVNNPREWLKDVLQDLVQSDESISDLFNPVVEKGFQSQYQRVQAEQEYNKAMDEVEAVIYEKGPNGQPLRGLDGQPALNDIGKRAMQAAQEELDRNQFDWNDRSPLAELRYARTVQHYANQFKQMATPPAAAKSLQEQRAENQRKVNGHNRIESLVDPGGGRDAQIPAKVDGPERRFGNSMPRGRAHLMGALQELENGHS